MIAFHGDARLKADRIERVRAHRAAGRLAKGTGWDGRRGCAVGCILEAYDHSRFESELGIPTRLAHLLDGMFESLPSADAIGLPERFLAAIRPGSDLSGVFAGVVASIGPAVSAVAGPTVETAVDRAVDLWKVGGTNEQFLVAAADLRSLASSGEIGGAGDAACVAHAITACYSAISPSAAFSLAALLISDDVECSTRILFSLLEAAP